MFIYNQLFGPKELKVDLYPSDRRLKIRNGLPGPPASQLSSSTDGNPSR